MATNEQRQQRRRVVREKPAGITQQGPDERAKRLTAELPMTRGDAVAVISLHSGVTTRRRPRANSGAFVAVVRETVGACGRGAVTSMSERQEELLEEILAWTRFSNRSDFIKALKDILADPKHLLAFELTDGSRTQTEVAKESGLSQPRVSTLWAKWRRLGLLMERSGRTVHLARPSDLGIEPRPGGSGSSKADEVES